MCSLRPLLCLYTYNSDDGGASRCSSDGSYRAAAVVCERSRPASQRGDRNLATALRLGFPCFRGPSSSISANTVTPWLRFTDQERDRRVCLPGVRGTQRLDR